MKIETHSSHINQALKQGTALRTRVTISISLGSHTIQEFTDTVESQRPALLYTSLYMAIL